jgi:undecaprenyl diphosphate synthase
LTFLFSEDCILAFSSRSRTDTSAADPESLKKGLIPQHIAIIMDGNGRWAKSRSMPRAFGHREGVRSVRAIVEGCAELGVRYLTLYAFSTENWKRPREEVSTLMSLLVSSLRAELQSLHKNNVRLTTIGDMSKLPIEAQNEWTEAIALTKDNTGLTLNLALSYSGRWDITRAVQSIAEDVARGDVKPEDVCEDLIASRLSTAALPDPDLLIRSSGELRISNFLLWELAYTEIYVTECFWPDFRKPQLYEAVSVFQRRERRFGLVSEQLTGSARKNPLKEERVNAFSSL